MWHESGTISPVLPPGTAARGETPNARDRPMSSTKKLIEVALPLEAINTESALRKRKAPTGYPTALHKWWAQRPLAVARAVIFAQMVDDPSAHSERFPTKEAQDAERQRLFELIEELITWENTTDETVLKRAGEEIWKSWRDTCAASQDHPRAAELFDPAKDSSRNNHSNTRHSESF